MTFSEALDLMKRDGELIRRSGWNGKNMFLFIVSSWTFLPIKEVSYPILPFIAMKTTDDKVVPWLASQTDLLSNDWELV